MMRLFALFVLLGSSLLAQEGPKPIPEVLILRRQVAILDLQNKVLAAQLAQEQIAGKLAQIDKEAGCVVDWNAQPPVCKPQGAK